MLSIYEAHEEHPIKCQLYYPVYEGEGNTKKTIDWQPSDIFCYCKEIEKFRTTQTTEQNRRYKQTKGVLETLSLKKDEITADWKIFYDGNLYIISEMEQIDDDKQQEYTRNPIVKTTLRVRR